MHGVIERAAKWDKRVLPHYRQENGGESAALNTGIKFTAGNPFGVANPGKFLFTGLAVGVQTVGGVPFRIIDPARNEGRAFVVLHSPQAPANREWPHRVEIPVNGQGERLFFPSICCVILSG